MQRPFILIVGGLALSTVLLFALYVAMRPPVATEPPELERFVLRDVTVVNPGIERTPHRQLLIERGDITAITGAADPTSMTGVVTQDLTLSRFDATGLFALPGLIDMHVHHPPDWLPGEVELFGLLFLRHGVTTVRDLGTLDGSIFEVRRRIQAGERIGPRIFACGYVLEGADGFRPASWVATPSEARAAVREQLSQGADCIKVFNNLTEDALSAIREVAAQHGSPVVGHVPFGVPFTRAGIADVQHLTGVVSLRQWAGTSRFAAQIQAWRDLGQQRIDTIVSISRRDEVTHTPTLVMMKGLAELADNEARSGVGAQALLPDHYRSVLWDPRRFPVVRDLARHDLVNAAARLEQMERVVGALHRADVQIFAGSDTPNPLVSPGASLQEELMLLSDAGMSPEEAWVSATRAPGAFLGTALLGTLAEGAPADIALFRDDPTRDLAALSTLEAVVTQGRLYTRQELDRAIAAHTRHHRSRVYRTVLNTVAKILLPRAAEVVEARQEGAP